MNAASILDYLRGQQLPDGSFAAMAGIDPAVFVPHRHQPSIFSTALVLDSLHSVVGSEDIRQRASKYLEAQVSKQGSWNYWANDSQAREEEPYPDDLDDTACTLAAIKHTDPEWITSFRLGQLARLLVGAEQKPGGPYNTWLTDVQSAPQWRQVDLAVNANIAYFLSLESTNVNALTEYLTGMISAGEFRSAYYVSEAPVLYFLSRALSDNVPLPLQQYVEAKLADVTNYHALDEALLLSSACWLYSDHSSLEKLANSLQNKLQTDHWQAEALYIDPVYEGKQHYGGSTSITTALALEALTAYANRNLKTPVIISQKRGTPNMLRRIRKDAESIADDVLRRQYLKIAKQIIADQVGDQIAEPATLVVHAGGWPLSTTIETLNLASINGWIAYTLYDNVLDGDGSPVQLTVANTALRRSQAYFSSVLPHNDAYQLFVQQTFDSMDAANNWEQHNACAPIRAGKVVIKRIPSYLPDYSQLAERSIGHSLAACAVLMLHYGLIDSKHVQAMREFYKHYLIARQLHDDAHDWEDDLKQGRLTAVVCLLIKDLYNLPCRIMIATDIEKLRQEFWLHTILQVSSLIQEQLALARNALTKLTDELDCSVFFSWLDKLELAADVALQGREDALQFMCAYEGQYAPQ